MYAISSPYLLLSMSFTGEERKQEDKHGAEPLSLEQLVFW
jgi:hypothetical protein